MVDSGGLQHSGPSQAQVELQCPACSFVAVNARELQVHYDGTHAVQMKLSPLLVFPNALCAQVFVYSRDQARHRCPAKPHTLEDLDKMASYPALQPASASPPSEFTSWRLFTDGAGPSPGAPIAGWGVAVWENASTSSEPSFELFGPVCLSSHDKRFLGAIAATNNVGELSAMVEARLWLESEAPGTRDLPALCGQIGSRIAHERRCGR